MQRPFATYHHVHVSYMWTFKSLNEWLFHSCVESFYVSKKKTKPLPQANKLLRRNLRAVSFFCISFSATHYHQFLRLLRKLKKEKREKSSVFQIQSTVGGRRGKKLTTKQPLGTEVAFRREYLSTPRKCEPGEIENKGTFMNFQRTCLPHESPDAFGHAALTIFERGCSGWGYCWLQQTRWFDSRLKMTYL